ncbi:MAG: hypothetical protein NUV45_05010 [Tepidanaerobacteraceae bacterium]|jgi:thymidylate kinase|nr:hypothetical protein [Tepidanaerobacteraceae bacterium]
MTRIGAALIEEGRMEGRIEGRIRKAQEAIIDAVKAKFEEIPDDLKEKIACINDEKKLDKLLVTVIKSNRLDEIYNLLT